MLSCLPWRRHKNQWFPSPQMIFSTYSVQQQGRVSASEWPHCCSDYFSMDRLVFSGMILSGGEIILNAGGDRRSQEYSCVLMTTAAKLSWRCTGKKSDNFLGASNTIRSVHTAEAFTIPQVRALDKWCCYFFFILKLKKAESINYCYDDFCIAFLLISFTVYSC